MHETRRARPVAYGVAVLATGVSLLLRWPLWPVIGDHTPFMTFFPAVILSAYFGGLGPGLVATFVSAAASAFFLLKPHFSFAVHDPADALALGLFTLTGVVLSALSESLHRSRGRILASERRYAITLESIGDAVLATDNQARVTFLNPAAEALTGWPRADAVGRPLAEVFRIVNEQTRQPAEDPAAKVLRSGRVVGLANHTALLARDGRAVPIDDCGAPIIDERGGIAGVVLVFRDVTRRRQAEEAGVFRRANERLELAVRGSNVGVWDLELPGGDYNRRRRHYLNVWEQLGYDGPPAGRESALDEADPDDRARLEQAVRRYLAGETAEFQTEIRLRHKDGSYRPMLARGAAVRDAAGKPVRMVGVVIDITDLKRAEQALRESEERFRGTFENAAVGIAHADATGRFLRVNERFCALVGYPREELLQKTFQDVTHPDDLAASMDAFTALMRGESPAFGLEKRYVRKDGSVVWGEVFASLQRDAAGASAYDIAIIHDITQRKRLEEALRASEERYRFLTQSIPQKIFTADANGDVDYFNQQWTEFTGLSFDQIKGWGWLQFIHPDDVDENVRRWRHSVDTGEPFQLEHRFRRADGVYRWHLSRALALRDAEGRVQMWFGSNTDIDDQKRAAEAFKQAKEAAEAANRAKDEFLANVSHEIRTPMNAILGMTELALDTELTEDQRQYLTTVKSAADNLLGILNDLLDFAKIEAGRLELDLGDFSLRSAVGSTLRALAARAHRKGLEVVCDVHPAVPDALIGDAGRLRQVLLNLVGNAIKFTEQGEVVVSVGMTNDSAMTNGGMMNDERSPTPDARTPQGEGSDSAFGLGASSFFRHSSFVILHFEVRDTGIGIPVDKQATIFRPFEQEDPSTTRKYGGTGLGLTIAARLVALMGGQIRVTSAPGQGSTFAFTARFGLQPHPAEPTAALPPALLRDLPVLIIDDNATNRHILEEWLRRWQMDPAAAGDGVAAMDALWEAAARGRPYALVLLDARMPDTDGLALAAQIRKRADLSATRIILLSSGDRPGDGDRVRELRIDAHLLKPIQQDELLDRIYQVMSRAKGDEPREARPGAGGKLLTAPAPATTPLHVLLAEDDEFSARFMERLLAQGGHRVRLAASGRETLALAEEGGFDLLLLDIHMPELDGFRVVGAIRERERATGGHLPVIALTARSRKEDRERCLAAGMDDFLTKPVATAALLAAIDRLLRKDEGNRTILDSSLIPVPSSPPLLDPVAVLTACGNDAEGLGRVCRDFQTYAPARLAELGDALRDRSAPRLRQAAHKFSALLFVFSTVAGNVASDLEDHAAQGRLEEAQPLVERLEAMAQELLRLVGGLSLETLRHQAERAADASRADRERP
jgi:two-component system, sensor histidine kinase and response regulator